MHVVIFCDMEGISCIETWEQVSAGKPFYEESRKLYTDEMNAAVRGARAAGAERSQWSIVTAQAEPTVSKAFCPNASNRARNMSLATPGRATSPLLKRAATPSYF